MITLFQTYMDEAGTDGAASGTSAGDVTPAAGDGTPAAGDGTPAAGDGTPAAGDDKSLIDDGKGPKDGDDKPKDGDDKPKDGDDKPIEYTAFTSPDGTELNSEAVESLKAFAQENKLPQEAAQKVVDMGVAMLASWEAAQVETKTALFAGWVNDTKADKEIGGDNLAQNLGLAKAATQKFGTPELIKAANETGMGNHPEFLRFCYRVARATGCDVLPAGDRTPQGQKSNETTFNYGSSDHN